MQNKLSFLSVLLYWGKRTLPVFCCLLLFCACGDTQTREEPAFYVKIVNLTDSEICSLRMEYGLHGAPAGGCGVQNADGTPFAFREVIWKDFVPADFPAETGPLDFYLELYLEAEDGTEYPCSPTQHWEAAYGNTYTFQISGDFHTGFTVERGGEPAA